MLFEEGDVEQRRVIVEELKDAQLDHLGFWVIVGVGEGVLRR